MPTCVSGIDRLVCEVPHTDSNSVLHASRYDDICNVSSASVLTKISLKRKAGSGIDQNGEVDGIVFLNLSFG